MLCRGAPFDPFLVAVAAWATLQLSWTSVLAISQLYQIMRQMTTFEVSNLGRYGYMGGRGGTSLRSQDGAMAKVYRANPAAAEAAAHGDECKHKHSGRCGLPGRICGALWMKITGPLFRLLGFDRFTKGKAVSGMARARRDQNPFDLGLVKVSPSSLSCKITADARTAQISGSAQTASTT